MSRALEISALQQSDPYIINAALRLMNRTHGEGLFDSNYLVSRIRSGDSLVLVGHLDRKFAAVGCAEIVKDFDYFLPFDPGIEDRLNGQKVGLLRTLSVQEEYQGQGFGKQMTQCRTQWLIEQGCGTILGVSWVSGLAHTSSRVFEKLGFRTVKRVDHFFREQAIRQPFDCPGCQVQPCECAAILYELKV